MLRLSALRLPASLFLPTLPALSSSRLTGVPLWRQRPESLFRDRSVPQTISHNYRVSRYRKQRDPDDPTKYMSMSGAFLLRCPNCKRVKLVDRQFGSKFHRCCEVFEMKAARGLHPQKPTVKRAVHLHNRLTTAIRQWDFSRNRPKSNPHKPHNRAHSKLPK